MVPRDRLSHDDVPGPAATALAVLLGLLAALGALAAASAGTGIAP